MVTPTALSADLNTEKMSVVSLTLEKINFKKEEGLLGNRLSVVNRRVQLSANCTRDIKSSFKK